MKGQKQLFEFLCQLIDIQIKKYVSLATVGVGPDARLNAKLVCDEVSELLEFAELIADTKGALHEEYPELLNVLFNQVKFYVEQEHARAYAGWLLDANNIHSPVLERVEEQLEQLKQIGQFAGIDWSSASKPITEIQKQCEYDSCAIAFYILDLAKSIKENPEMELDSNIPKHAQVVLKRNATTRYCIEKIAISIEELHKKYTDFLSHSDLKKSSNFLSKEDAKLYEEQHKKQLKNLLNHYQAIEPSSKLFSSDHEWYKIAVNPLEKKKPESIHSSKNPMLFGGIVIASAVAIYMLIAYFMQQDNENALKSVFKF